MRLFFLLIGLFTISCFYAYKTYGPPEKIEFFQETGELIVDHNSSVEERIKETFCKAIAPIEKFQKEKIYSSAKEKRQEIGKVESPSAQISIETEKEPGSLPLLCANRFYQPTEKKSDLAEVSKKEAETKEIELSDALYADKLYRPIEKNEPVDEKASPVTPQEPVTAEKPEQKSEEKEDEKKKLEKSNKKDNESSIQPLTADEAYEQGRLKTAYFLYLYDLKMNPCNDKAIGGLLNVANTWGTKQKNQQKVLHAYREVLKCKPDNPEILFFLGRQLFWMGKTKEAAKVLQRAIVLSADYTDAVEVLIKVYIRLKEWELAKALLRQYPTIRSGQLDYATVVYRRRNYAKAEAIYRHILRKSPNDEVARHGLARSYSAQRKYCASRNEYARLTSQDPKKDQYWKEYMGIRSHTNIGTFWEGSYTKSKENDPDIKAPVVRDFYTLGAYHVFIPINDILKLDFKQIFFHQKEDDIFPPMGINYNAYVQGAQIKTNISLFRFLKCNTVLRVLGARGYNHNVFFPFKSTTRFEPGISLVYSDSLQYLIWNAHIESFVYKNFDKITSGLLRTLYLHGGYLFRPNIPLKPEIEATFDEVFYHDAIRNVRNTVNLWGRFNLFTKHVRFIYRFENSHFRHASRNYFSFKRQFRNTLGGIAAVEVTNRLYLEAQYLYRWEYNIGLVQPIGIFTFKADVQRLQSYRVVAKIIYRIRDYLRIEAAGHIFYSTLPYEDFNVRGNMLWQF